MTLCVVMCGKAIETICVEKTSERQLGVGLKKLVEKGIIDNRLFEWAEVLRKQRNIGAHATEDETSREDAKDVLAFAIALCDYIYVLAEKYKEFIERKARKLKGKAGLLPVWLTPPYANLACLSNSMGLRYPSGECRRVEL